MIKRRRTFTLIALALLAVSALGVSNWSRDRSNNVNTDTAQANQGELRANKALEIPSSVTGNPGASHQPTQPEIVDSALDDATEQIDSRTQKSGQYRRYDAFRKQSRQFFEQASSLPATERLARAKRLNREITWAERNDFLLPAESLQLKLALIETTASSEDEKLERSQRLLTEYDRRAAEARAAVTPDPRHLQYKAEEADIVRQIMASTQYATKRERQIALRSELINLRTRIYAQ